MDSVDVDARPHVVFALVDDYGSYDASFRQKDLKRTPQLRTPTMDRLVAEGIRLDSYYVQHICTPTRSQLMSRWVLCRV